MKRVVFFGLAIYAIIAFVLIITMKEAKKDVNILSFTKNYARLMTESETITIPLYIDSDDSFITEKNNITNSRISDDLNEISVEIIAIRNDESISLYKNKEYYNYFFEIGFDWTNLENLNFTLDNAQLSLTYKNGEEFKFNIGNMSLSFISINPSNYLDISNLSGIVNEVENEKYLVGLNLKLLNLSNNEIRINQISTNADFIKFDLKNVQETQVSYDSNYDFNLIIPGYDHFEMLEEKSFVLDDNYYLVIPIVYDKEFIKINRFPLFIEYEYNNQVQLLVIDDFLFFNEGINLDDYVDEITEYKYIYP